MKKVKELYSYMVGRVYIPDELLNSREGLLLHISDTPYSLFSGLKSLIKNLKPKYIVHTGDLVDNIKLEMYPYRTNEYRKKLNSLMKILEESTAKKVFITIGNHDKIDIVKELTKRSVIIDKVGLIDIENITFKISHYSKEVMSSPEEFNLFGHDMSKNTSKEENNIYLNGIAGINVIGLESKNIYILKYPYGTNEERMCKHNIGF